MLIYVYGCTIVGIVFAVGMAFLFSPSLSSRIFQRYPPGMSSWISATPGWAIRLLGACFVLGSVILFIGLLTSGGKR